MQNPITKTASDKKITTSAIKKVTVELTPIQLVWLHSQHYFQKIEEESIQKGYDIKFYKNNTGVQLRYQKPTDSNSMDPLIKIKDDLVKLVQSNELRLLNTSLNKDLYVRILREARKQFPKAYIIFLHYQTFQNICRKLREKFSITSITVQLEKLRKQNPYFCFLVAEKEKIDQIQKFTDRLLKSEVSCAATTFSQKHRDRGDQSIPLYRRTMSVSSLKGSFASFNSYQDRNDLQHCRISLQPSQTQQQMFEVSQVILYNLTSAQLDKVIRKRTFYGTRVHIQSFQGNYLAMKRKLYYANRLQLNSNPRMQPVYAYSMVQKQANKWKLSLVTDKHYKRLSDLWQESYFHSFKMKIQIFIQIGRAILCLHKNRETYGDLKDSNILLTPDRKLVLSCTIDKSVPPHTNPYDYDIRQLLLLIYKIFTKTQLSYDCLMKKLELQNYFCSMAHRCKNTLVKQFLQLTDQIFIGQINLTEYIEDSAKLIKQT